MSFKNHALAALAVVVAAVFGAPHAAHAAGQDFKNCTLEIGANDAMQFDKKELDVPADCTEVKVVLTHTGKLPASAMGHNWVLVKGADLTAVANAGMAAGLAANYLPAGDARVIAATKIIGGGEKTEITFPASKLSKGGDYKFFCSFPGHYVIMQGVLKY